MGSSTCFEFLPADVAGLSPLARAALGGELSVPGLVVARAAGDISQPADRFDHEARAALAGRLEEAAGCVSPPIPVLESIRALREPGEPEQEEEEDEDDMDGARTGHAEE